MHTDVFSGTTKTKGVQIKMGKRCSKGNECTNVLMLFQVETTTRTAKTKTCCIPIMSYAV